MTLRGTIPCRTVSESNTRCHWTSRMRRARKQRLLSCLLTQSMLKGKPLAGPYRIHLSRCGRRRLDDDNLRGALKAVRDGISDAIGIDDGNDALVRWEYSQTFSPLYSVLIEIEGEASTK